MPAIESAFAAGEGDFAVQHTANGKQFFAQMAYLSRWTAQDRHLQTMPLAEMNVQTGHNQMVMVMLLVDETGGQLAGMVIVHERDHGHLLGVRPALRATPRG